MWGWLVFLIGILYGYMTPGKQNKTEILKKGILIGLVLGVVLALVAYVAGLDALGMGAGVTLVGTLISVVVLTILFIIGVWLGDILEHKVPRRS